MPRIGYSMRGIVMTIKRINNIKNALTLYLLNPG